MEVLIQQIETWHFWVIWFQAGLVVMLFDKSLNSEIKNINQRLNELVKKDAMPSHLFGDLFGIILSTMSRLVISLIKFFIVLLTPYFFVITIMSVSK